MGSGQRVVIVGGGLAAAKAAESLRGWGHDGAITLVTEEPHRPYERPALSKGYLRGRSRFDDLAVHPAGYYSEHGIEVLTSTPVTALDPAARTITLGGAGTLSYDRLLLATGARPRRLEAPGHDLAGVHYLRTVEEADRIREAAQAGARVVVVGAGWVGTEVVASLRRLGAEVALIGRSPVPLAGLGSEEVGGVVARLHAERDVELHLGRTLAAVHGSGSAESVELDDGSRLGCDLVVVGLGVEPRTELAAATGITTADGIVTDEYLRTNAPGVYAAGDVASVLNSALGARLRSEHWWSALTQGPVAAANMAGHPARYDWIPTFTSKQYDLMLEHTGYAPAWDSLVFRGEPDSRHFAAFWMREGTVRAALTANLAGTAHHLRVLVAAGWAGTAVDPAALADPDSDLADLVETLKGGATRHSSEEVHLMMTNDGHEHGHGQPEGEELRTPGIGEGLRQWYESCPCCMSQALPDVKQALDEERAAASRQG